MKNLSRKIQGLSRRSFTHQSFLQQSFVGAKNLLALFIVILSLNAINSNAFAYDCRGGLKKVAAPKLSTPEKVLSQFFSAADVKIGGGRDQDIEVHDPRFYKRVIQDPTLQIGETYMDRQWDSPAIDQTVAKIYEAQQKNGLLKTYAPFLATPILTGKAIIRNIYRYVSDSLINRQTRTGSKQVAQEHYDLGNDLFHPMLGASMAYTSGKWGKGYTLEDAQNAKYELAAQNMGVKPGDHILDIGCGFGGLARYLAKYHGVKVTGITISIEQLKLARALSASTPGVDFIFSDYRDIPHRFAPKTFDHVVSIEMVEAVGPKNLEEYFNIINSTMKDGGHFVMQAISNRRDMVNNNPWVGKHIFPNGVAPSLRQYDQASARAFGKPIYRNDMTADYDLTLMNWHKNFTESWPTLAPKYGARFKRMWDFYLLAAAGIFRSNQQQLHQSVYVKGAHSSEGVLPVAELPIELLKQRRASALEKANEIKIVEELEKEKERENQSAAPISKAPLVPLAKNAKIAVIGAGPGGLSAARKLQELGYNVTVLEANEKVGGKTHTVEIDGRAQDLGATVGFNGKYDDVIAFGEESGQETVPFPKSNFYSLKTGSLEAPKTMAQSLRLKLQGLKYLIHHLKLSGFSEKGLEVPSSELADSWYVLLSRLGLKEFAQEMRKFLEGFGYGDDDTPAISAYRLFSIKAVLGSATKSKPMIWVNGTQAIWQGVASKLNDVRTSARATKVTRYEPGKGVDIYVNDSTTPEHFDNLIMATDPRTALKILDPTSEESDLFSRVKYMPYATFAVRVEGFSDNMAEVGYLRENMARKFGRPMAWIKRYADQNVFIFHLFAPPEMSDEQIMANIAEDMRKLGGQKFTLVDSRRWPFFPHVDSATMREHRFYERTRNLQGKNNTVFINEALGMSTMPDASTQGTKAAERLASGEYHP